MSFWDGKSLVPLIAPVLVAISSVAVLVAEFKVEVIRADDDGEE